ncbi:MAG TPA: alkaline phosphatase family protein [Longimicrobiales bacterium]|nr:alkaline phosphatase family protein [Longimicrobiales bacterium]
MTTLTERPARVLLVFLDGVGIGPDDPEANPLVRARARIPALQNLTGGSTPTLARPRAEGPLGRAFPLTATLGVPGTPQSGTGQAALLTGENAAALFGRHFGPWTPVALRPLVEERSVLRAAADAGRTVAFANAYPRGWPGPNGGRRLAGPPLAARGAGVLDRHEEALAEGTAVASEITNDGWRERLGHARVPRVTPEEAGANLARIARTADLTLYAHYATDAAGHRRDMAAAVEALVRVDRLLAGLLAELSADTLLLVASDHGNLEDVRGGHTTNPALGIAAGPGAGDAARLADIRDVAWFLLEALAAA